MSAAHRAFEVVIPARPRSLGGVPISRVLPSPARRRVGPFVFLDHSGPVIFDAGHGLDVPPHPHIGLATMTYLFEGEIVHRDHLGTEQLVRPGEVNWMTAGSGIVHSERTPAASRAHGATLHGLQLWVALPKEDEECAPSFAHHSAPSLPRTAEPRVSATVCAGTAFGAASPVAVRSPLFFVDVQLEAGGAFAPPAASEHAERALYVVHGDVTCEGTDLSPRCMAVLSASATPTLRAREPARVIMLGGAPLDGPRSIWWNFVSSSQDRIREAARAWKANEFPLILGDSSERVPLRDEPNFARRDADEGV